VDVDAAVADGAPLVHPELDSNLAAEIPAAADPELDAVFAAAAHVVTETFAQHRHVCAPMETRGVVAEWDQWRGDLTVWLSTQGPHGARGFLSRALRLPENRVRVLMGDVGGAFGQKMFMVPDELAVVLAGRKVGRPVKWVEDRRENLIAGLHARADRMTISMAVDGDGRILAVRGDLVEDVGSFAAPGSSAGGFVGLLLPGPYRIPKVGFAARAVYTNTCGRCSYRGPWMMETLVREQMMDVVAAAVGLDPLEFRRRNAITPADLPYAMATGLVLDDVSSSATLEQAAEVLGYPGLRAEQQRARADGRLLGIGLSLYVEPSGLAIGSLSSEAATVAVSVNGQVQALMSTASHGQSVETTVAQVVADELGVDVGDVTVVQGDTAASPYGPGTGGSRSAVIAGGAAREAARQVRGRMLEIAAHLLEAAPDDLEITDGVVSVAGAPGPGVSVPELARVAYLQPERLPPDTGMGLEAHARFRPSAPFTFSVSCHACVCEVDPVTGAVTLLRYVVSEDCGVMINPAVVEGQIAGGVVQGIGGVLHEHLAYDADGTPLATTFVDYLLPTAAEVPTIEYAHLETPARSNPGGHRGMGEGGAIGAPAAVANAVRDALAPLGVRLPAMPLTPAVLAGAIATAEGS
jgi:carbon-monoxide dehydrogenase large subunit